MEATRSTTPDLVIVKRHQRLSFIASYSLALDTLAALLKIESIDYTTCHNSREYSVFPAVDIPLRVT
jgi:hypothetical protein